jgi:hypothetical protein
VCRAFAYDDSASATLSEQLLEPVAALQSGLTNFGGGVAAFIPGAPPSIPSLQCHHNTSNFRGCSMVAVCRGGEEDKAELVQQENKGRMMVPPQFVKAA